MIRLTAQECLDIWMPILSVEVPGAGEGELKAELLRAARDFCDRSRVWRMAADIEFPHDARIAPLPADGQTVRSIDMAWIGRVNARRLCIEPKLGRDMLGRQAVEIRKPIAWGCGHGCHGAKMRVALTVIPNRDAAVFRLPEYIADGYADYIAAGAQARLQMRPGRPYSSQEGAAVAMSEYRHGIAEAAARLNALAWPNVAVEFDVGGSFSPDEIPDGLERPTDASSIADAVQALLGAVHGAGENPQSIERPTDMTSVADAVDFILAQIHGRVPHPPHPHHHHGSMPPCRH